jgi:hypothetical protein
MKRIVTLILFLVFSLAITASAGAVTVLFDPFDDNGNRWTVILQIPSDVLHQNLSHKPSEAPNLGHLPGSQPFMRWVLVSPRQTDQPIGCGDVVRKRGEAADLGGGGRIRDVDHLPL